MPTLRRNPCVAVIGDMVASRAVRRTSRAAVQRHFQDLIDELNQRFRRHILADFVITLGDEFQGLLRNGAVIPDLVWLVDSYTDRKIRLGFGFGRIDTLIPEQAINVDGPALHKARTAISFAKKQRRLGGVFLGFGDDGDVVLNGFAAILQSHRARLNPPRRRVIDLVRAGLSQTDAAAVLKIRKQAVSQHVKAAGWQSYLAAENGWRHTFALIDRASR